MELLTDFEFTQETLHTLPYWTTGQLVEFVIVFLNYREISRVHLSWHWAPTFIQCVFKVVIITAVADDVLPPALNSNLDLWPPELQRANHKELWPVITPGEVQLRGRRHKIGLKIGRKLGEKWRAGEGSIVSEMTATPRYFFFSDTSQ